MIFLTQLRIGFAYTKEHLTYTNAKVNGFRMALLLFFGVIS